MFFAPKVNTNYDNKKSGFYGLILNRAILSIKLSTKAELSTHTKVFAHLKYCKRLKKARVLTFDL